MEATRSVHGTVEGERGLERRSKHSLLTFFFCPRLLVGSLSCDWLALDDEGWERRRKRGRRNLLFLGMNVAYH